MKLIDCKLTLKDVAVAKKRRRTAMALHEIEGNAFAPETIATFEMFERERWSHERRLAYLKNWVRKLVGHSKAAE